MAKTSVQITRRPDLQSVKKRIGDAAERQMARSILQAKREIRERTESGRDADNKPFPKYSKSYKAQRAESGRSTTVNLLWSGAMLNSITGDVKRIGSQITGELSIGAAQAQKAKQHMTGVYGNRDTGKVRKFFAFSQKQLKEIASQVNSAIAAAWRGN